MKRGLLIGLSVAALMAVGVVLWLWLGPGPSDEVRDQLRDHAAPVSVWYVDNSADSGSGTLESPFNRLKQAEVASSPGDWICILTGDGTSAGLDEGILLKERQTLVGQGSSMTLDGNLVAPPGSPPLISAASGPAIRLSNKNRVSSLRIRSAADGVLGEGVDGTEIQDVEIVEAGGSGVALVQCRGVLSLHRLNLAGAKGLRLEGNAGRVDASDISYR